MICISVTPESRKLAKVDLLNASRNCDMIELCMDKFIKEPDIGEMISGIEKPILVSCRRPEEGGHWKGSDEQRLGLLRNAIVAGPAYVELDMETAAKVPRFGDTKRVVSFTSLDRALSDVDEIFQRATELKADVVKFTWPTPTLDETWPLLVAVSKKTTVPTVGIGLGDSGITFSLLGRRYGSPWIYAALEQGMEAHPGQSTVWELDDVYDYHAIDSSTRFVGVVGMGSATKDVIRLFNGAFKSVGSHLRCLPLALGKQTDKLKKQLDVLKVKALIVSPQEGARLGSFVDKAESSVQKTGYVDLLLNQKEGWAGFNTASRTILRALEAALVEQGGSDERPLEKRNVLMIGSGGLSRAIAHAVKKGHGVLSVTGPNDKEAQKAAEESEIRHVPYGNLYGTLADVVIFTDSTIGIGHRKDQFNPSYLRPHMTFLEASNVAGSSELLNEAQQRGCKVVSSRDILREQLSVQFKALSGTEMPGDVLDAHFAAAAG